MKIKIKAPQNKIEGAIDIDGDKSITHRAMMIASIANGTTTILNYLKAKDCLSTLNILKALGVKLVVSENSLEIEGVGLKGLKEPSLPLNAGNSGTTMRLLTGILSGQDFLSVLYGDKSLSKRPMRRIIGPLKSFGANLYGRDKNKYPPIVILPCNKINNFRYHSEIASAQVKSSILFASLFNNDKSIYSEIYQSRDHTERMLKTFGADISLDDNKIFISGNKELIATDIEVPGDFSTASYFLGLAGTYESAHLLIRNVNINHTRTGLLEVLKDMGLNYELLNSKLVNNEPVADIEVKNSKLSNINVSKESIAQMIDEIPLLAFIASQASGVMIIEGIKELAYKESDRIKSTKYLFDKFGLKIEITKDKMIIRGNNTIKVKQPIQINHFGDHRVAMTAIIMSLVLKKEIILNHPEVIDISSPNFLENINKITRSIIINE